MSDFGVDKSRDFLSARRLKGVVETVLVAPGRHFVTTVTAALDLTFDGILGDHHSGATRKSGGREPWYPRGTVIRNERQVSIVAADELEIIARSMAVNSIKPEWLGANIVVTGIPKLSMLPPRTLLFFESGLTLKVDGQNAPCKLAGRVVAEGLGSSDLEATALAFVAAAKRLRGLVAWVEKPGHLNAGATFEARLPEQWLYQS